MKNLFLLLALVISFKSYSKATLKYSDRGKYQLLEFKGELMPGFGDRKIKKEIQKIHGRTDIVFEVSSSRGGEVSKFKNLIKNIRKTCEKKRGSDCYITSVFTGICGSACTYFPFFSDRAVSLSYASFGFHRKWIITVNFTIQSIENSAQDYIKLGGNPTWFKENAEKLASEQKQGYWMTKEEELESLMIDEQFSSYNDFLRSL